MRQPRISLATQAPAALAALALALGLLAPRTAGAQSPFPDREGVLANGTELSLSAARIEREFDERLGEPYGLEGLVLVVDSCQPDPEVYLDQALPHFGLAAGPGQLNANAAVWLVCLDPRFVGFYYSDEGPFPATPDDEAITDAMVDALQAGNFTGAAVEGIETLAEAQAASAADRGRAAGAAADGEREGLPWGWILAGLAAGGGGWWWLRRRRRGGDAPEARGDADRERAGPGEEDPLAAGLEALEESLREDSPALARLILLYEPSGEEAMLALHERHEEMLARKAALRERAAGLRSPSPSSPAPPPGSPEARAAEEAGRAYRDALAEAEALRAYAEGLPGEAEHAERLVKDAAVLLEEARDALERGRAAYAMAAARLQERLEDAAALPPEGDVFALPARLADEAESELSAGRRLPAGERAEDAAALAERLAALPPRLHALDEAIDRGAEDFERLQAFSDAGWADVRGNGSEAEESLDTALAMLARLAAAAPEDFGADPAEGLSASLDRLGEEMARGLSLAEALGARLAMIRDARDGLADRLQAARAELDEGRAWLRSPEVDRDVDAAPDASLDEAAGILEAVAEGSREARPDWLALQARLLRAERRIDEALGGARAQRERLTALLRQLDAARQEAEAALDRADRYLRAHARDAGPMAESALREARFDRGEAARAESALRGREERRAADAEAAIEAWQRAAEAADKAYAAAEEDVREADRRRGRYAPRPDWMGPTVPTPMPRRGWPGGLGQGPPIVLPMPPRPSRWGSRPSGGRPGGRPGGSRGGGSRSSGSGSRRGGGRGW